jgi:hypothetical protein
MALGRRERAEAGIDDVTEGCRVDAALNVTAGVITIISFILALTQTLRYKQARDSLAEIRRIKNAEIWSDIATTLQAYKSLDEARELVPSDSKDLYGKVNSARRAIITHYIQLLRQAILDEPEFTEETVEFWKRTGRLDTEWRVAQAMIFVQPPNRPKRGRRKVGAPTTEARADNDSQ